MRMVDLIEKKRRGAAHTAQELQWVVEGFVRGEIPDYQMSAWMMAVCFQGMDQEETAALTLAMTHSGDVMDLSALPGVKVDKHSTGGVGDTTTLVVAPVTAACGGTVAKMSGRGLGHTGGTLDKLEAIRGTDVALSEQRFLQIVRANGVCVTGQTKNLDPADRLMYALRDVTGTVKSIPLIASSVMSKKFAAGADAIVLDVKCGSGAFMEKLEDARTLARCMVEIGKRLGKRTTAVITDMDQPLGMAVGNGLEVKEAVELLTGKLPQTDPLYRVCLLLSARMLMLSGLAQTQQEGERRARAAIEDGSAFARLKGMIGDMGGDTALLEHPQRMCETALCQELCLDGSGYLARVDAMGVGAAAQRLGAGRATKADQIDPAVGLVMHKRAGEPVSPGEPVATLYANDPQKLEEGRQALLAALTLGRQQPEPRPLVYDIIED